MAAPADVANYRRVWARDGVVCSLAALATGDAELRAAARATLETLATHQDPLGRIPSNVQVGGEGRVSFGGLVGRLDAPAWFVVGVTEYARLTGDAELALALRGSVERALALLEAWDHNGRGLIYAPPGADWADELDLHGYTLCLNALRVWALRRAGVCYRELGWVEHAAALAQTLDRELWPRPEVAPEQVRHAPAWTARLADPVEHWQAGFGPLGYDARFDALGTSLAVALELGDVDRRARALDAGQALARATAPGLVPAFWPPVEPGQPGWSGLALAHAGELRNQPSAYHNGGVWPFVNGFWGLALLAAGRVDQATAARARLVELCAAGDGYCEFAHAQTGEPQGVTPIGWSAAAVILLEAALDGRGLAFGAAS